MKNVKERMHCPLLLCCRISLERKRLQSLILTFAAYHLPLFHILFSCLMIHYSKSKRKEAAVLYLNFSSSFHTFSVPVFFCFSCALQDLSNKDMKRDLYIISQVIRTGKLYSMTSRSGWTKKSTTPTRCHTIQP